ncbi:maleylpyruvate isomerase family mycothiol-dependent enzyme [Rhodococcus sp. IEGM 1408]|uniref:maleylpyruvate isomerase family mycothiol-dependent enzyme n=1 Tax=Rhodococcus sp. IEGM 1408 TaxID=3082220 RepID=UPI002952FA02|nr:maleylpyruvate isomerase family mycothiol-dependent enzyme [Rhodococcus sp. IEGM 1408]MDV8002032.1 maleylpyruvate isomerase family mycothiol-dependent enzyme [Rhodococcus sp. IEGM 1408]
MGRAPVDRDRLWSAIHLERGALASELERLDDADWHATSLCTEWTVEEVVAHLTAVARTGRVRWIRSFAGALFDTDRHNRRRLDEQLGSTPGGTLENFLLSSGLRVAPFGDVAAWLGETIVHAEDIRRPLGLRRDHPMDALTSVARFYAARDFAVNSATVAADLRLRATDGPFEAGNGPAVEGPTLALVMTMAGRPAYLDDLSGDGVGELRRRIG